MHRFFLVPVFPLLGCVFFSRLPWSFSFLCWDVVMHRLSPLFVLPLMDCGFPQASSSLCLTSVGLWLCIDFPMSWSCLCWAVVVNRLPNLAIRAVFFLQASPVVFLPLLCCGYAEASPSLSLTFGGMWSYTVFSQFWSYL